MFNTRIQSLVKHLCKCLIFRMIALDLYIREWCIIITNNHSSHKIQDFGGGLYVH